MKYKNQDGDNIIWNFIFVACILVIIYACWMYSKQIDTIQRLMNNNGRMQQQFQKPNVNNFNVQRAADGRLLQ